MFAIKSVLLFMIILVSYCQRRIKDGEEVTIDRKYMVYLIKAPKSEVGYDFWLCGGAIVSSQFVITSAACVLDVDFIYVVAGYKKYVPDDEIETDKCTSVMKKKAIYTCSPRGYELKYGELDYWSYIDIALVKVDSPFDFDDERYVTLCSYKPTTIAINYEEKYQEPGTDALVLGWGHLTSWRSAGDRTNYNADMLRYAPTLLLNQTTCIEHYADYPNMSVVIKSYMICSLGKGNINDAGNTILESLPLQRGCTSDQLKVLGFEGISCEQGDLDESYDDDDTRRHNRGSNKTNNNSVSDFNETQARRTGICQNDHGGPLVTWVGAREILIGIASVFKVSDAMECMGPYLYTSTLCTGRFLDCTLSSTEFPDDRRRRSDLCDSSPSERGYDLIERTISWKDYPGGPESDENIGRMPKANISPGLKYLSYNNEPPQQSHTKNVENAKNQEETKYESNNMYSGHENPAIISNAPKEGFEIKEKYPENKSISGMETLPVNDQSPGKQILRVNDQSPGMKIFRVNDRAPGKQSFPVNDRSPGKQSFPVNDRSPGKQSFPVNERSPGKQSFPVNDRSPGKQSFPVNDRSPGKQSFPVNERYPANQSRLANQKHLVTGRYPVTGRYRVSVGRFKNFMKVPSKIAVRPQHPLRNLTLL